MPMSKRPYKKRPRKYKPKLKAKNLDRRIKKLETHEELKYVDGYASGAVDNATGALYTHVMTRGTAINNRVGDVVYPTSLQIRGQFKSNTSNASSVQIRQIIFWDMQPNGGVPTIIGSPSPTVPPLLDTATITDPTFAPHCLQSMKRYKIIYDKVHTLIPTMGTVSSITNNLSATATDTLTSANSVSKFYRTYNKLSRVIKYAGNGGTYADIVSNFLWVLFISDQASNAPTVEYGGRMYYKDA